MPSDTCAAIPDRRALAASTARSRGVPRFRRKEGRPWNTTPRRQGVWSSRAERRLPSTWWSRTRLGLHPERLQRLHQRLDARLLASGVQAAPVAEAPQQRAEPHRGPGGLVTEAEVRDELVDGHVARGGSSTCVSVRRPWSSPWPSTRPCGTSRRQASPGTDARWRGRSRPAAFACSGWARAARVSCPAGCAVAPSTPSRSCPASSRGSGASVFHAVANVDLPLLRVPGVPFVLTVHDSIPLTSPRTVSRAFRWQFRLWLARSLQVADHVVCVSAWTRAQLLLRHPELDPERVSVVHNGVDHVQSRAPPRRGLAGLAAEPGAPGALDPLRRRARRPEERGAGAGGPGAARPARAHPGDRRTALVRLGRDRAAHRDAPRRRARHPPAGATSPSRCSGP